MKHAREHYRVHFDANVPYIVCDSSLRETCRVCNSESSFYVMCVYEPSDVNNTNKGSPEKYRTKQQHNNQHTTKITHDTRVEKNIRSEWNERQVVKAHQNASHACE